MNSNTLRIGILGAGRIAEKMAKTIAAMSDVTILAVASRLLERAYDNYETLAIMQQMDARIFMILGETE